MSSTADTVALEHVPINRWGKDHWSTFAYAETCVVDKMNADGEPYLGELNRDRLRCNADRHGELMGRRVALCTNHSWKAEHGTRLKGFFKDNRVQNRNQIELHDDWDCLEDMEREGLLQIVSYVNGFIKFTEKGVALAARVREHKIRGGNFADFETVFTPAMLIETPAPATKTGLTAADIIVGHVYEAKRPSMVLFNGGVMNDRKVVYTSKTQVQYDGPTVRDGRHFPTVSMDAFLNWAKRDVTDEMTKNQWRVYARQK
jgi:hypothetical protein